MAYKKITAVNSFDPNEKLGPTNNPFNHYIKGDQPISYQINFENLSTATAPAQVVTVIDTLDSQVFDFTSFHWTSVGFGKTYSKRAPGVSSTFAALIDMRPQTNLLVKVDALFVPATGVVTTTFVSLDPSTLELTDDPVAGFLPPNVDPGSGEGYITFSVAPKSDLVTGASLRNKGHIYFDNNEPIITNTFTNLIDKASPSSMVAKAELLDNNEVKVTLQGNDTHAGVRGYDVYVAENDEPYQLWLRDVSLSEFTFTGTTGTTYKMYSVAKDYAGNQEAPKSVSEASIALITTATEQQLDNHELAGLYPNPTVGDVNVKLKLLKSQVVTVSIYNSTGTMVEAVETSMAAGEQHVAISLTGLAPGMYIARIYSLEVKAVKKFAILTQKN